MIHQEFVQGAVLGIFHYYSTRVIGTQRVNLQHTLVGTMQKGLGTPKQVSLK